MKFKFIHAADLHIDSPLRGLDSYEDAPVDQIRGATRKALANLVDLALREDVDLVLFVGDLFDRELGEFSGALFFRKQLVRLVEAGIQVFIVKGNHDAEGQITKRVPNVDGVHVFSSRVAEVIDIPKLGVAVHGKSFPERKVPEDLVPSYPEPVAGRFNIGMLHTSLNGRTGHDSYAPTDETTLVAKGYDYFALGHVHVREVVREANPRIVFPGNLQGRKVTEIGSKGCELVTVEGGTITSSEHIPLDVVRWHDITLDIAGANNASSLADRFRDACGGLVAGAMDRLHAIRVTVKGESDLALIEARDPGSVAAAIQAASQDFSGAGLWIESVHLDLRSPIDRREAAQRQDAVGEVVKLIDELAQDEESLRSWSLANMDKLPPLPSDLADLDPAKLTSAQLRAYLADAEATVLSKLSSAVV